MSKPNVVAVFFIVLVAVCAGIAIKEKALDRQKRVIGGDAYTKGEFPFHVSLWFMGDNPYTANTPNLHHVCGGVLVEKDWVLTNAVCFDENLIPGLSNLTLWHAKLGMYAQTKADQEAQSCSIVEVFPSPEYNLTASYGDVAVIKLGCEAQLSSSVATIDINEDSACPQVDQDVTVIGWGQTQNVTYGQGSDVPHKAKVEVVSDDFCQDRYAQDDIASLAPNLHFGDATLCAGVPEGGVDACYGDAGSPLLAKCGGPNSPTVAVGVVSYGFGCAKPNTPAVYGRISHFSAWIKNTINSN